MGPRSNKGLSLGEAYLQRAKRDSGAPIFESGDSETSSTMWIYGMLHVGEGLSCVVRPRETAGALLGVPVAALDAAHAMLAQAMGAILIGIGMTAFLLRTERLSPSFLVSLILQVVLIGLAAATVIVAGVPRLSPEQTAEDSGGHWRRVPLVAVLFQSMGLAALLSRTFKGAHRRSLGVPEGFAVGSQTRLQKIVDEVQSGQMASTGPQGGAFQRKRWKEGFD
jgi:hypothetical protein